MNSHLGLVRVLGERIGHLSRHAQTGQLCRELRDVSSVLDSDPAIAAFRRGFFRAGGREADWSGYVEGAISGEVPPAVEPTPDGALEDREWDQLWRELVGRHLVVDETAFEGSSHDGA